MTDATEGLELRQVERYLREHLSRENLQLTKLSRNVGGMSRETWFADATWVEDDGQESQTFTLRLDHPDGSVVPVPLRFEYDVYRTLDGTDIPAAKALWFEDDPGWLGRPFYVRDTIRGSSAPRQLFREGADDLRRTIGLQLARLLGRIHTLDWRSAGFPSFMAVPETAEDCALMELARWRGNYEENRAEPKPVVTELFSWLRHNAPRDVPQVSLVWGDVGLGNFIFQGDEVVGLTDWEQAHLGDPMKDWASALWRGVDNLLPREELFEAYEQESGITIDEERIRYYTVFIDAQYICTSHPLVRRINELDGAVDITFARLGMGIPFHCQDDGLRAIGY